MGQIFQEMSGVGPRTESERNNQLISNGKDAIDLIYHHQSSLVSRLGCLNKKLLAKRIPHGLTPWIKL